MLETAAILESAASFLKLGAKKLRLDYDEEADVLYVSFRRPQKATDSRMEGDLIYHYRDEELVGVTILHASEIGQQGETGSKYKNKTFPNGRLCACMSSGPPRRWTRPRLEAIPKSISPAIHANPPYFSLLMRVLWQKLPPS